MRLLGRVLLGGQLRESLLNPYRLRTVRDSGEPFALHLYSSIKLKECTRAIRCACIRASPTTTYRDRSRERLPSGRDASAAEMKELIYLPESYNSLSTCIHTSLPRVPAPPRPSAALGFFSFRPLFSSACRLRPYQPLSKFLPILLPRRRGSAQLLPLCTFLRPFRMAVHAHNFRAPLPVTYVDAFTQPRVQSILSSSSSSALRVRGRYSLST